MTSESKNSEMKTQQNKKTLTAEETLVHRC